MHRHLRAALMAAALVTAGSAPALGQPAASADTVAPARPHLIQASMNVYRRFPPEIRDKMVEFYNMVLGLQALTPINLGGGQQMLLFKVGAGQIKLASGLKQGRQYHPGGAVNDATGIRVITFYFPDAAALAERFKAAGYPAPVFKDRGDGTRAALVKDPGGFNLELVAAPGASPETYGKVDVGINSADLAKSEAFYRDFVGLTPEPLVKDEVLGVTKHPFRNGTTTIELWSVGKNLPADTGSAGVQYITDNVAAVAALATEKGVTVEEPLGGVPGFPVRTVWLNDPDGATDYFYQFVGQRGGGR